MCRKLLFSLAGTGEGDDVPEKPKNWRSQCSAVLYQPVSSSNHGQIVVINVFPSISY